MTNKSLVYFCNEIDSVFDSQVLELLLALSKKNIFKKVYLFLGLRTEEYKQKLKERILPENLELVFYRSFPNYAFFNLLLRKELSKVIKKNNLVLNESIFHTRGELLSWHLSKILSKEHHKNILPDIRGATVEETTEFQNLNYFKKYFKIWNKKRALNSLNNFKIVSAVSETLGKYLTEGYGINPDKISITPCLAGGNFQFDKVQRIEIRKELNLTDKDILIVFSTASSALWQNNSVLKILGDKEMKVLNLSRKEIRHVNVINKFIDYCKMPLYLNAADIAIIWRDKSIVNKVASPVKFSEYLCCGLPVISNDNIDLVKNIITENNVGIILNNINDVNEDTIMKSLKIDKQHISKIGKDNFGLEAILEKYQSIYRKF